MIFTTLLDNEYLFFCSFPLPLTNMFCLSRIFIVISVLLFTNVILLLHKSFFIVESGQLCASWVSLCYSSPDVSPCQSHLIVFVILCKDRQPPQYTPYIPKSVSMVILDCTTLIPAQIITPVQYFLVYRPCVSPYSRKTKWRFRKIVNVDVFFTNGGWDFISLSVIFY